MLWVGLNSKRNITDDHNFQLVITMNKERIEEKKIKFFTRFLFFHFILIIIYALVISIFDLICSVLLISGTKKVRELSVE